MSDPFTNVVSALGVALAQTSGAAISNAAFNPFSSAAGSALAGASGAFSGAIWVASEFAKFGKKVGGRPGEISAAALGVGPGAMAGFFVGSLLGTLSGTNMINFYLGRQAGERFGADRGTATSAVRRFTAEEVSGTGQSSQ
jgi:hypothetical protein